jgi:two-component system, OmpR family, alkaline phosphatase synthesis response regulator PhoP
MKLLIVEDEETLREMLVLNFSLEGYQTQSVSDGPEAVKVWRTWQPDLVVLDVMLPKMSGFVVCQTMRQQGHHTPVIFLTAKAEIADRMSGLESGADDYLTKPFHLPELLLRVKNLLRRAAWYALPQDKLEFAGHCVDFRRHTALLSGGHVETLGARELMMLKLFAERANQVVSRDEILDAVWGQDQFPSQRTVDNFIVRLRKLFEPDPTNPRFLHTIWGVGYKFTPTLD